MSKNSQNGWPGITKSNDSRLVNHGVITGKVLKGDVFTVLDWAAKEYEKHVEAIRRDWSWGWNYRSIRGALALSNHASATCEDWNAPRHPLGVHPSKTMSKAQISACREIASRTGGVLRWGGDYAGRKDTMHWEINRNAAAVKALADQIRGNVAPIGRPNPVTPPKSDPVWKGLSAKDTTNVQRYLRSTGHYRFAIDGKYQNETRNAVRAFQNDAIKYGGANFKADGEWGPLTQKWMVWVRDVLQPRVDDWAASQRLGHLLGDGHYGPLLNKHVKAVQEDNWKLYVKAGGGTADGQAGPITCKMLGISKDPTH